MKLKTIVKAHTTVEEIAADKKIGTHLAYWLAKFIAATQSDTDFYVAELKKIIEKYNATVHDDGGIEVGAEHRDKFLNAVEALQNTDAQDPGIRFSLSELSSELKMSLQQMYPLLDFIDEEK
jgi:hypothetical protein